MFQLSDKEINQINSREEQINRQMWQNVSTKHDASILRFNVAFNKTHHNHHQDKSVNYRYLPLQTRRFHSIGTY